VVFEEWLLLRNAGQATPQLGIWNQVNAGWNVCLLPNDDLSFV
jgi:hypothetical protein